MTARPSMEPIEIGRIFLDLENPRHEPYTSEAEVIEYLCRYENVFPLAKDIVQLGGVNPLELLAVIPDKGSGGGKEGKKSYTVAEGNRRLCALKLLDDPERAPAKLRKNFEDLAAEWDGPDTLLCTVFDDHESVRIWLSRIHEGEQGGAGRRKWTADQIARHSGDTKNRVALAVMDYAVTEGLITPEARKGKLTTVQRYLGSAHVREALGIDSTNLSDISRNRSKHDFDLLLRKFLDDLASGYVNSRSNREQHTAYARELGAVQGQSHERTAAVSLAKKSSVGDKPNAKPKRPAKQKPRRYVPFEQEVLDALEKLKGDKLSNLYTSICSVPLDAHTPLVTIGAWALLESLTAQAGRTTDTDFQSFFSKRRLQGYGLSTGKGDKGITEALRRVATSGDVIKHDGSATLFNSAQLINDMETLTDLIVKCADEASSK